MRRRGESPAGGLAEAFATEAGPIARFWPSDVLADDPEADPVAPDEAATLTTAVAQALADDLAPLTSLLGLDVREGDPYDMTGRLDSALRRLDAVRRVAARRPSLRMHSSMEEIDTAFATVARQLGIQAAATLAARAVAAEERNTSGSASMAVTMHELRRPLTVLSSYSQLLSRGALGELTERGRTAALSMIAATEVMVRLIEALAAVARLEDPSEPVELTVVDLAEVVERAVADAETEASLKGVAINAEVEDSLLVRGDRERLTTAVANLVSNAVKHSPSGAAVEVRGHRDGNAAHIIVRDHGPGFPAETAERLFEKYYRDAGEREQGIPGTGLGLFIVLTVAERHNGRAEARPAAGGGAEFELTLPALAAG